MRNNKARNSEPIENRLYERIAGYIRARIFDCTYETDARIPSESELGVMFGASRITVRHALGMLQRDGLIYTLHGKGSFVARAKAYQNVSNLTGLAESMSPLGHEVLNELRNLDTIVADSRITSHLALPPGTPVIEIKRVRMLNREPLSLELTYVPVSLGERLAASDLARRDIFEIIENDCGVFLGHADLQIEATQADNELAEALHLGCGAAVMRIERLTHDREGHPIDFEYLYYRADLFQYRLRTNRVERRN
jgi:GntR family transcriptional regulator